MFTKIFGIFAPSSEGSDQPNDQYLNKRRKRLHTRHWRAEKKKPAGSWDLQSSSSKENLPPNTLPPQELQKFNARAQKELDARGAKDSSSEMGHEAIRRVRDENRTLKERVLQLEDELAQCKRQTTEELARFRRQIEGLNEMLAKRVQKKEAKLKKQKEKENKKRSKKAKTSETTVTAQVVPLALVPPPPAPPPAIVITEEGRVGLASLAEAKNKLKRRAPATEDKAAPSRPKPAAGQPFALSLNDVLQTKKALKPAVHRQRSAKKPAREQDEFKAALLKKFENVNIYSPTPTPMACNDSFTECLSPYRAF